MEGDHAMIVTLAFAQLILDVQGALSKGAHKNASECNWINLQSIRARKCVTRQLQPSLWFMKRPLNPY